MKKIDNEYFIAYFDEKDHYHNESGPAIFHKKYNSCSFLINGKQIY